MATDIRVRELRMVRAGDLVPSPYNWRQHPEAQRTAIDAVLQEIGYIDALKVREVNGGLELVDGHLRAELDPDQEVPVLIVDLDDNEARKAIATFDPIGAMAATDAELYRELLADTHGESEAMEGYLDSLRRLLTATVPSTSGAQEPELQDEYLVTIALPAALFEEFEQVLKPWREVDGVTVNISTPS